jgi:hypothetical protein
MRKTGSAAHQTQEQLRQLVPVQTGTVSGFFRCDVLVLLLGSLVATARIVGIAVINLNILGPGAERTQETHFRGHLGPKCARHQRALG